MNHLSVSTEELPHSTVRNFSCPYKMGDHFVGNISDVDCPSCLRQIAKARASEKV